MLESPRADVLVVEDERDLLLLMALILREAGFVIRTASDGREALDRVAGAMPALILLDMKMPVMNGAKFLREFDRRYGRLVPVVLVSAADDVARRAAEVAADGWLSKPFDPDALIEIVKRYLGRSDAHHPA